MCIRDRTTWATSWWSCRIWQNGISLPTHFGFDGYKSALDMAPIFKFFGNSVIVTCCATVLNVLV